MVLKQTGGTDKAFFYMKAKVKVDTALMHICSHIKYIFHCNVDFYSRFFIEDKLLSLFINFERKITWMQVEYVIEYFIYSSTLCEKLLKNYFDE